LLDFVRLKKMMFRMEILTFRLEISCDNSCHGCEVVVKLDLLPHHLKECEHNPKRPVTCTQGCGQTVAKDEMKVKEGLVCLFSNFKVKVNYADI
jgi:E3 ubiquitin-protein ligase NRDP1